MYIYSSAESVWELVRVQLHFSFQYVSWVGGEGSSYASNNTACEMA